jgi:hypothetical protein
LKKPFIKTRLGIILFILLFFYQCYPVFAQDELSDSQIEERLRVVQQMLKQGEPNADRWWCGWLIGYSAATVGQGAIFLTSDDKKLRQDMALGAVTTLLGAVGQIVDPMVPGYAPNRLGSFPESTPEQRRIKLAEAEEWLMKSALREKEGRSWKTHAITGIVNLGSGLVVWLGFKRDIWEGAGNFALNTVITEIQIWTQPTKAIKDYNEYLNRYKSGSNTGCIRSEVKWSLNVYPGGVGITVLF